MNSGYDSDNNTTYDKRWLSGSDGLYYDLTSSKRHRKNPHTPLTTISPMEKKKKKVSFRLEPSYSPYKGGPMRVDYDSGSDIEYEENKKESYATIVVDLDNTLLSENKRLVHGYEKFLTNLRNMFPRSHLVLWSHADREHVIPYWDNYLKKHFDVFLTGYVPDMEQFGKPPTEVRKLCKHKEKLQGPMIIIDDKESNLRADQYDFTINISHYYISSDNCELLIDYDAAARDINALKCKWYSACATHHLR